MLISYPSSPRASLISMLDDKNSLADREFVLDSHCRDRVSCECQRKHKVTLIDISGRNIVYTSVCNFAAIKDPGCNENGILIRSIWLI